MPRAASPLHAGDPPRPHSVPNVLGDGFDASDDEGVDELSEETGIDLTDASELDADNVPTDEEADRVIQAPD